MNRMYNGVFLLIVLAAFSAIRLFSYARALYQGDISELPEEVRLIRTFNDCSMFVQNQNNHRLFTFSRDKNKAEAYLRFRVPKFNPSDYMLRFSIRARPELLKDSFLRTAKKRIKFGKVKDDIMTFVIDMKDDQSFMWNDGACYVGVGLPLAMLRPGDVVELVDFKFSLR